MAVADGLASMGVSVMGETNESTPVAVIRQIKVTATNRKLSSHDIVVDPGTGYLCQRTTTLRLFVLYKQIFITQRFNIPYYDI